MLNQVVGAFGLAIVGRVAYESYSRRNDKYNIEINSIFDLFKDDVLEPFKPFGDYLPQFLQSVKMPLDFLYVVGASGSFTSLCIKSLDAFLEGNNHFAAIALSATIFALCAGEIKNMYFIEKKQFGENGLEFARQFTKETHKFLTSFIREDSSLSRY